MDFFTFYRWKSRSQGNKTIFRNMLLQCPGKSQQGGWPCNETSLPQTFNPWQAWVFLFAEVVPWLVTWHWLKTPWRKERFRLSGRFSSCRRNKGSASRWGYRTSVRATCSSRHQTVWWCRRKRSDSLWSSRWFVAACRWWWSSCRWLWRRKPNGAILLHQ